MGDAIDNGTKDLPKINLPKVLSPNLFRAGLAHR